MCWKENREASVSSRYAEIYSALLVDFHEESSGIPEVTIVVVNHVDELRYRKEHPASRLRVAIMFREVLYRYRGDDARARRWAPDEFHCVLAPKNA